MGASELVQMLDAMPWRVVDIRIGVMVGQQYWGFDYTLHLASASHFCRNSVIFIMLENSQVGM